MSPPGVAISVWCSQPGVFLNSKKFFFIFAKHESFEFPPKVYCYKQPKFCILPKNIYFAKANILCCVKIQTY
jgi:hypothetical protein